MKGPWNTVYILRLFLSILLYILFFQACAWLWCHCKFMECVLISCVIYILFVCLFSSWKAAGLRKARGFGALRRVYNKHRVLHIVFSCSRSVKLFRDYIKTYIQKHFWFFLLYILPFIVESLTRAEQGSGHFSILFLRHTMYLIWWLALLLWWAAWCQMVVMMVILLASLFEPEQLAQTSLHPG